MITKEPIGGYRKIYEDQLRRLADADINACAEAIGLVLHTPGEVEVPFVGATHLISRRGVKRDDGRTVSEVTASALIHYVLDGGRSRPVGQFITFSELAGPLFGQSSYSKDALERPITKRFQGRVPELLTVAASIGGHPGGEAGLGSVSIVFDLLPYMPMQLVFYDRDEEFSARAILLFDPNATKMIEFEVVAVLATIFVDALIR